MRVILVRHGESEANVTDFVNDDPHHIVNLTERGKAQAAAAAERLRTAPLTQAFVSEFPRAQQTARIILQPHGLAAVVDARLNERKSGMDGLPTCTFNDMVLPDPIHIKPPLGESFLEQTERVRAFLDGLASVGPEATVLAVTHEYPIRSALVLAGIALEDAVLKPIANCAAVTLVRVDSGWSLVPELEE